MPSSIIVICDKQPPISGIYVAYVNGPAERFADRMLLFWDDKAKRWCYPFSDQNYREHVYGWVGPLPTMQLEVQAVLGSASR